MLLTFNQSEVCLLECRTSLYLLRFRKTKTVTRLKNLLLRDFDQFTLDHRNCFASCLSISFNYVYGDL